MSELQLALPGFYFFLSYAHSAPSASRFDAEADPSISAFFYDLQAAVLCLARPARDMRIGFFDQQIPPGTEIKTHLSHALGVAEVFVPLYSPAYFARSWPQREQAVFYKRLRAAAAAEPDRHIIPVLWNPLAPWERNPDVLRALGNQPDNTDYWDNGLRALSMLAAYRRSYELVLWWLAEEIVTVAEQLTLGPSPAPDLDDVAVPDPHEGRFLVALLGPDQATIPDEPAGGGNRLWWKAYTGRRFESVAEHAGIVAERLGLRTQVAEFTALEGLFDGAPAIVIVEPQILADRGVEYLQSTFAGLPAWILPVILDPGGGPDSTHAVERVAALIGPQRTSATKIGSVDEFDEILPTLVARARRTYLRHGQVFPPDDSSPRPPRLRDTTVSGDGDDWDHG